MSTAVSQAEFALLKAQIEELTQTNRVLYDDYFKLMNLYRNSVGEISAAVFTKLTSLEKHITAMDAKLSLLCMQQGIEVDSALESVTEFASAFEDTVAKGLEDACTSATDNIANAERFSLDYHKDLASKKELLLNEIYLTNQEIARLRQEISFH